MKTIAGIGLTLSVLLIIGLLCGAIIADAYANAPARPALFIQAITMDALDGHELSRKNVSGPYETVDDCSKAQLETGAQHPVLNPGGPPTITVFSCVALQGGVTS